MVKVGLKRILAMVLTLTAVLGCSSCASQSDDTMPTETSNDIGGEKELLPEDIVYPEEELPRIYIQTENGFQVTSKKEYSDCNVRFELNDRFSSYSSTFTDSDGGEAKLRCRGNATYNNPEMKAKNKYSYKLKLSKKANVLGMGESKHWYLINNWRDTSNLRHKLAYDLADMLGLSHTDSQWVTLYYNGEYRGLYLLCESIRVAEDRVDTFNWEEFSEEIAERYALDNGFSSDEKDNLTEKMENNLAWITTGYFDYTFLNKTKKRLDLTPYFDPDDLDLTTGYLVEYCTGMDTSGAKWKTKKGVPVVLDNPMMLHTNQEMYNYLKTLVQDFEDALFSPTFRNEKGKHYSEYLDVESLVDYWIVWNFFCNNEFGSRSLYYYIDHGKIVFGPVWDFDQTIGNVTTVATKNAKGDYWVHDQKNAWFKEIFGDPWFTSLCQQKWYSMREVVDDLIGSVDLYFDYMGEEAERCYERNGVRYYTIRQPEANGGHSLTPTEDYELIKRWLNNRVKWIDDNFKRKDPNVDGGGYYRSKSVTFKVTLDDSLLPSDNITVYGTAADYLISPTATGKIKIKILTTDNNAQKVDLYLNGTEYFGKRFLKMSVPAEYLIDVSCLDMTEGAVNVIYLPVYKSNGSLLCMSSILIKVSSANNPEKDECVVWFGDEVRIVKKESTVTFPEAPVKRDGYVLCGWTTGDSNVYRPGDTVTVDGNVSYYLKWKRIDRFSLMDFN